MMTPPISPDPAVAIGRDGSVLERILQPDVHLSIWQSGGPSGGPSSGAGGGWRTGLPSMLDGLDWDSIADIDEEVAVDTLVSTIPDLMTASGYPDSAALAGDVVALAVHFAAMVGSETLRVRLDVIETDACRKFHADQVTVRLLAPLRGPGTQWMRAGGTSPHPDGQLQIGDVGIFKGRVWADPTVILHRSPPIAGSGITRLLLVIDPVVGISGSD